MIKRLRIFAGPNGSGKSTLKDIISGSCKLGVYINADDIKSSVTDDGILNFSDFGLTLDETDFKTTLLKSSFIGSLEKTEINSISSKGNSLIPGPLGANDYFVSFIADYLREKLLLSCSKFSFETVMSHESKLAFINKAKVANFKTYLYFITLHNPDLNVLRVKSRVGLGGHNVSEKKIIERYYRTMDLLFDTIKLVDKAYLFDNSAGEPKLIAQMEDGELKTLVEYAPAWYQEYVLNKIVNS